MILQPSCSTKRDKTQQTDRTILRLINFFRLKQTLDQILIIILITITKIIIQEQLITIIVTIIKIIITIAADSKNLPKNIIELIFF